MAGIGLDVSERMLQAANARFRDHGRIELLRHDLAEPLPALGRLLVRDPPPGARPEALALLEVARDALLIGVKPAGTALAT